MFRKDVVSVERVDRHLEQVDFACLGSVVVLEQDGVEGGKNFGDLLERGLRREVSGEPVSEAMFGESGRLEAIFLQSVGRFERGGRRHSGGAHYSDFFHCDSGEESVPHAFCESGGRARGSPSQSDGTSISTEAPKRLNGDREHRAAETAEKILNPTKGRVFFFSVSSVPQFLREAPLCDLKLVGMG